jgi:NADPH-dependent 2,4-dienoyl-CoA reductase/sulfur reductase-like enzyme/nitrite reductase/ring-hydroxylating ferredoxin subunit
MDEADAVGPDLTQGVAGDDLADGGMLAGHVGDEAVLLARRGGDVFAIGATCTHYSGPLAQGIVVDDTVRCPWHHACFSLRTGEALRAPALSPVACWLTELRDGKVFVRTKKEQAAPKAKVSVPGAQSPRRMVIIGGGAAGFAAAERLRREQYQGSIVMLSSDDAPPVDRPNLSKDYLAGTAPEDWIPLRPESFYPEQGIELRLGVNVTRIDVASREVLLADGGKVPYDRLLLATGAEPVRLPLPGMELTHVHTLRSLADCRAIIARASSARRAVVMGASFIGLEVAASLRARGIEVHVVAPEKRPMERILGSEMGDFVRALHEEHGVNFHLEDTATAIDDQRVQLKSGARIDADLVVVGVGVKPRTALAESASMAIDRGVVVDATLETSAPGIFAAGDIARWPDRHTGESIRVEHWVVAQRQGQTAALNMLGRREEFDAVPFFWSQHFDVPINYVGHAESWDELAIEGDIAARDCLLRYVRKGRTLAVASIFRDVESLQAELEMERAAA